MHHAITRLLPWRITLALTLVASLAGGAPVLARHGVQPEPDDRVEFWSVAEQEIELEDDMLVWQASELPTFLDKAAPIPFYSGFLYAHDAPLVIYRGGGTRFTRLGAADAFPVEDGELLAPVALRADDATFLALELVAEDDAFDPAGEPFELEAGAYVLELLRAEVARAEGEQAEDAEDEPFSLDEVELPVLLVVVAGEVELRVEDEDPEELKTGDVLTVDEDVNLRWIGEEPGVVLAAVLRLPEEDEDDRGDDPEDLEDPADDPRPTTTPSGDADRGGGTGSGSGGGASEPAPTPTPKPTEAPGEAPTGESPAPPPTGGNNGTGGAGSGSGSGSGSGGVGVEERPQGGGGECLYCAPAQDGLFEEDASGDPCLLADGGGDPDYDELSNCGELAAGTDPNNPDSDWDGADDGFEVRTGTDPLDQDTDRDGLNDWDEFTSSTNPLNPDTDGDGLTDYQELFIYGTKPNFVDTDGDCLSDGDEVLVYGTDPWSEDTDGDGYDDYLEISSGYNPLDPGHYPEDVVAGSGCGALAVRTSS